jgi:opacity protein-like surface antigen
VKKLIAITGMAAVLAIPATASAAYGTQPGFETATANTVCAGAGAFGAFGAAGDVYHDFGINTNNNLNGATPGTPGYQVGLNNSGLCGNR